MGLYAKEVWGETGSDELPDRVIVQCFVHMICTNKTLCYVPVHLPFREFCLFHVDYTPEVGNIIIEEGIKFWEGNVIKDIPPMNIAPRLDVVKRIRKNPNKTVPVTSDLIEAYLSMKETLKVAKHDADNAQALLLAALDGAEEGVTESGRKVTNYTQQRAGYTTEDTEYAVLRFPKK